MRVVSLERTPGMRRQRRHRRQESDPGPEPRLLPDRRLPAQRPGPGAGAAPAGERPDGRPGAPGRHRLHPREPGRHRLPADVPRGRVPGGPRLLSTPIQPGHAPPNPVDTLHGVRPDPLARVCQGHSARRRATSARPASLSRRGSPSTPPTPARSCNRTTELSARVRRRPTWFSPVPSASPSASSVVVRWEGILPFTQRDSGKLSPNSEGPGGAGTLTDEAGNFCSSGVEVGDVLAMIGCEEDRECEPTRNEVCYRAAPGAQGACLPRSLVADEAWTRLCQSELGSRRRYEIKSVSRTQMALQLKPDEVPRPTIAACNPRVDNDAVCQPDADPPAGSQPARRPWLPVPAIAPGAAPLPEALRGPRLGRGALAAKRRAVPGRLRLRGHGQHRRGTGLRRGARPPARVHARRCPLPGPGWPGLHRGLRRAAVLLPDARDHGRGLRARPRLARRCSISRLPLAAPACTSIPPGVKAEAVLESLYDPAKEGPAGNPCLFRPG